MRVIADLHIHSCYSRATSQRMHVQEIARFARIKGLNIVGTGDFTHPKWLRELTETLTEDPEKDLYIAKKEPKHPVHFLLSSEVSTVFSFEGKTKKIHHVILTPTLDTAKQINERLARYGDLAADGRPTLNMDAPSLVEETMEMSSRNMVFPAHAWTPWFSIFGAFSGFDNLKDCYQDTSKHIHALETGLSSDPPMNWRLSSLDTLTLLSNSDCHSFWPWRIGREANVLELENISYSEITDTISSKDTKRFRYTVETNPAYGKYHWTGHRNCNVMLSPHEAKKFRNVCPVCRRQLTKGVEQRVEELADRPADYKPKDAVSFMHLLPLSEIIAVVLEVDSPSAQQVWSVYNDLVQSFGNEYSVLIDASRAQICELAGENVADAIIRVRRGLVNVVPGYDGVYGRLTFSKENREKNISQRVQQLNLTDFN